jgi:hypothetical protein
MIIFTNAIKHKLTVINRLAKELAFSHQRVQSVDKYIFYKKQKITEYIFTTYTHKPVNENKLYILLLHALHM